MLGSVRDALRMAADSCDVAFKSTQQGVGIREEPPATTTTEQGMRVEKKDGKGGRYSQIKTMLSSVKGEGKYGLKEDVGMEEKGKLREWLIELREDIMDEVV